MYINSSNSWDIYPVCSSLLNLSAIFDSLSTAEEQVGKEEKRLLESVTERTVFSPSFIDINAYELVNDNGVLCTNFCHMDCVQWTLSGSTGDFLLFESLPITFSTTNSLRYWTSFSMVLHLLGHTTRSFRREYLSFMLDRSCRQRLRVSVLFPNPH